MIAMVKGKVPGDDVKVSLLSLKPNAKVMMMGTREENLVWSQRLYVTTLCYSHIVDWLQSSNVADPTLHTDTHHLK
jgi:hypothetical protein